MKNKGKIIALITLFVFAITFISCTSNNNIIEPLEKMTIDILDIGSADCIIIRSKDKTAIIDTGEKNDKNDLLNYLDKNDIDTIDYLILTHFDKDHIGGAAKLIKDKDVKKVIEPDYTKESDEFTKLIDALAKNDITPYVLTKNMSFELNDVSFTIYPPLKSDYGEDASNEFSLVVSVTHGNNKFLFAGDAQNERLNELSTQIGDLSSTFLKVPHHGRIDENSNTFFNQVKPKYAVITCSEKNPPDDEVIEDLKKIGTKVYLTSEGQVTCNSDGRELSIECKMQNEGGN